MSAHDPADIVRLQLEICRSGEGYADESFCPKPASRASATAWAWLLTSSLEKIVETWLRTVFALLPSSLASASLSRPREQLQDLILARSQNVEPGRRPRWQELPARS